MLRLHETSELADDLYLATTAATVATTAAAAEPAVIPTIPVSRDVVVVVGVIDVVARSVGVVVVEVHIEMESPVATVAAASAVAAAATTVAAATTAPAAASATVDEARTCGDPGGAGVGRGGRGTQAHDSAG
jgi:hypothetical protein